MRKMTSKEQEEKWAALRDGMSMRERSAWISVLTTAAVYGFYFWTVFHGGPTGYAGYLGLLVGSVVVLVVLQIVLTIMVTVAVALRSPQDARAPEDEREKLFALKASRVAHVVLAVGVVSVIGAMFFGMPRDLAINALFLALILAELAKSAAQIVYFRLGG